MRKHIYHLNKASDGGEGGEGGGTSFSLSGEGPYAFKTLWQEITKGLDAMFGHVVDAAKTRNTNSAQTAQWYWLQAKDRGDSRDSNLGFYILLGGVLVFGLVVFIVKNKKSK